MKKLRIKFRDLELEAHGPSTLVSLAIIAGVVTLPIILIALGVGLVG